MKVTFPHMGNILIYKKLLESFGHEVIAPPRPSQRTIDLGVKYSPEFACFPYKVLLGSYIEALELGADTVVTSGGSGPCRAGFYSEIHYKTLQHLGFNPRFIVFDDYGRNPRQFRNNLKIIKGRLTWAQALQRVWTTYRLAEALDNLQRQVELKRCYEVNRGSFNQAFNVICNRFVREVNHVGDVRRIWRESNELVNSIPCRPTPEQRKIHVGIVGEIYVVMESAINMNIAEVLNNLGCEVTRSMYISEWVNHCIYPKCFANKSGAKLVRDSRPYIEIGIGGHEQHNIGNIIKYKNRHFDGVIHLMPFACLPELVTQSILPRLSQDLELPVLSLAIDEQTGRANSLTRIEAFVELIRSIKRQSISLKQGDLQYEQGLFRG
jgi:predicted nucleotide-binding protein (sugar kinase/HSP70/actin superfamily)